jgi:hypothetical protein
MFRPSLCVVGALALMAACSDNDNVVHVANVATVRLVNDTDTPLTFTFPGVRDSARTIVFGQASGCVLVDLTNAPPQLVVTNGVTGASVFLSPAVVALQNLTVVAFGVRPDSVRFATLNNRFVPVANTAGLRFFNGVATTGPLLMQRNGAALTPFTGFGFASGFVSVPIDSGSITFASQSSVVLDAGRLAFPMGQNSTVFVGPAAALTNPLRFFTVQGC